MSDLNSNTKLVKTLKVVIPKRLRELILKSFLYQNHKALGDWRYPFLTIGWKIAALLTRARKVSVDGIEFTLPCANWITHFRWYLFKTKEIEVRKYIKENVKEGDIFFDIGANIGVFTVYAAKIKKNIKVYSFEPEYSNLNLLKQNVLDNDISDQVNIFSVGLSDEVGFSQLHIQDTEPGAAAHSESRQNIKTTDEGYPVLWKEGIMTSTLDHLCEDLQIYPNCIKIDTDGNELKILKGASYTLNNPVLRSLIIEMPLYEEEKMIACENILKASGFKPSWSDRKNTMNEVWVRE
tara:strand:+ start:332 stop:1213 length:882 start_codon:yes stop_codon:yes gene_type:complete